MFKKLSGVFFAIITLKICNSCEHPHVSWSSFTTQDATIITSIAYISEIKFKCETGDVNNLYADIEGNIGSVSKTGQNTYQVSWVEDVKSARSGERVIRLFDEDGFTSLKKAIRSGQDISSVKPLSTIIVNHPGAFTGPWFKSEFIAVVVSSVIAYMAISCRSKLAS